MKHYPRYLIALVLLVCTGAAFYLFLAKAPSAQVDPFWTQSQPDSEEIVHHEQWQEILDEYLITDHPSGINRFDYAGLVDDGTEALRDYLNELSALDPRTYNRAEQFAYWVNLYNALTVKLIADNYPLESITELGEGALSFGPWDDPLISVVGCELTLNDIEHRILRPIWQDHRIHFAVNCAGIGCPNLGAKAFSGDNKEVLLAQAARDYLRHPRGLSIEGKQLVLSSIFDWYKDDFGANQYDRLRTLAKYSPKNMEDVLASYSGDITFRYDWMLNAE